MAGELSLRGAGVDHSSIELAQLIPGEKYIGPKMNCGLDLFSLSGLDAVQVKCHLVPVRSQFATVHRRRRARPLPCF